MGLHALQQDLVEELDEHLSVLAAGHPVAEVGAVYEEVEQSFQATACCALLVSADRASFQKHLVWSALARRDFLQRSRDEGRAGDFRLARSRSEALFCAVAAGDLALAIEIGDLSPDTWVPEGEYEEDFAYHVFLHRVLKGAPAVERESALRDFDTAVGGAPAPRLEVCQALQKGAPEDFESALQGLIGAHTALLDEARPGSADMPTFEPRSRIFVEGLALLRLAANAGLPLAERDYPLCPGVGRVKALQRRPDDLFAELASVRATQGGSRRGPKP